LQDYPVAVECTPREIFRGKPFTRLEWAPLNPIKEPLCTVAAPGVTDVKVSVGPDSNRFTATTTIGSQAQTPSSIGSGGPPSSENGSKGSGKGEKGSGKGEKGSGKDDKTPGKDDKTPGKSNAPKDSTNRPAGTQPKTSNVGVSYGVDHYADRNRFQTLRCCVKDAEGISARLAKCDGFLPFIYRNQEVTRDAMGRVLLLHASNENVKGRSLVISFAGHGKDAAGWPCLWAHCGTSVRVHELVNSVAVLDPEHILIICDSCRVESMELVAPLPAPDVPCLFLYGCARNESSREDAAIGHGYATKFLLDAFDELLAMQNPITVQDVVSKYLGIAKDRGFRQHVKVEQSAGHWGRYVLRQALPPAPTPLLTARVPSPRPGVLKSEGRTKVGDSLANKTAVPIEVAASS